MFERLDFRLFRIGVEQDVILRRLAVDALDSERKSSEVIEVVVIVDDPIQIRRTAVKAFLNAGQRVAIFIRIDGSPGVGGIGVCHLAEICVRHLIS